jgi:hypothetical protein
MRDESLRWGGPEMIEKAVLEKETRKQETAGSGSSWSLLAI